MDSAERAMESLVEVKIEPLKVVEEKPAMERAMESLVEVKVEPLKVVKEKPAMEPLVESNPVVEETPAMEPLVESNPVVEENLPVEPLAVESSKMNWSVSQKRLDVDNQLMTLYTSSVQKIAIADRQYRTNQPMRIETQYGRVFYSEEVVDRPLAIAARNFVKQIPFDITKPMINDTDNPVRDHVHTLLRHTSPPKIDFPAADPSNWTWENYSRSIWRAIPLTVKDFCGSPIYALIETIVWNWVNWFTIWDKTPVCWVLQRVPHGKFIRPHNDEYVDANRCMAFVYYLTDDDWTEDDGGLLHVGVGSDVPVTVDNIGDYVDHQSLIPHADISKAYLPKFNSIVAWTMKPNPDSTLQESPLHWVSRIEAPDDKPRIALVGFYQQRM